MVGPNPYDFYEYKRETFGDFLTLEDLVNMKVEIRVNESRSLGERLVTDPSSTGLRRK